MSKPPWWLLLALAVLLVDAGMDAVGGEVRDAVKTVLIVDLVFYAVRSKPRST